MAAATLSAAMLSKVYITGDRPLPPDAPVDFSDAPSVSALAIRCSRRKPGWISTGPRLSPGHSYPGHRITCWNCLALYTDWKACTSRTSVRIRIRTGKPFIFALAAEALSKRGTQERPARIGG